MIGLHRSPRSDERRRWPPDYKSDGTISINWANPGIPSAGNTAVAGWLWKKAPSTNMDSRKPRPGQPCAASKSPSPDHWWTPHGTTGQGRESIPATLAFRQRLEEHRKDPNCAGCHSRMDPLGFALENFDAIGGWRTESGGAPVDASGVLVNGEKVEGPVALKDALLARRALFLRHLTEKMLAYALGRGLEHHDIPAVRRIVEQSAAQDHRATALVLEVVKSYPFQWRRGENPPRDVAATP